MARDISRLEEELKDGTLTRPERQEIEEELRGRLAKLGGAHDGVSIELISDRLKQQEGIAEFFYREGAGTQRKTDWTQAVWEKNRENIRKHSSRLVTAAFASPGWGRNSLETAGLAEVVYPGIDMLKPRAEFVGMLPNDGVRQVVQDSRRGFWTHLE
jgi:hypothetical protein